jgi:hypothetical protein
VKAEYCRLIAAVIVAAAVVVTDIPAPTNKATTAAGKQAVIRSPFHDADGAVMMCNRMLMVYSWRGQKSYSDVVVFQSIQR